MKYLLITIALLFSFPFAYAETQIFSGKAITGTDKTIDGNVFRFTYDEYSRKAFVDTPAGSLIVENGACKPNNVFRVCINSANFSHKNITTYVYYYEIDATIHKLTGSLSASSKTALASLLQNEQNEITITVTNPTDFEITNIAFNYNLANFSITEAKGCEINGNILQWKDSLQPRYDKICTATISSDKAGTYSLSGNLSYFNGFDTEKKATDALPITILPKQLKTNQLIDKNVEVKKPFYLNLSLQNAHSSEEISGFLAIILPSHVSLIKDAPFFEKDAKTLKRSFILKPDAGVNYSLYLEKISDGKEPISSSFVYTIKGLKEEIENRTFVDFIVPEQIKIPEPAIKQPEPEIKKEENKTINAATVQTQASAQIAGENKTTETALKPENNTTKLEQIIAENLQKPKLFNKNILLLAVAVIVAFLIVLLTIFKISKGRKKDDAMEKLKEGLKTDEIK
jgi:hypothetical protein